MPSTRKLLSITNLKKYFPIAKSSLFQKEQLYVRANEDITLDIYEGETLGVVGESGCGKSTLGRVLLQLYDQTAGTTMYYGIPRASVAPAYVTDTLRHTDRYIAKLKKEQAKADDLTAKVEAAGDNATFFEIQAKNLAVAEAQTTLAHVAKIMGGFLVRDTKAGAQLLCQQAVREERVAKLNAEAHDLRLEAEALEGELSDAFDARKKRVEKKLAQVRKAETAKQASVAVLKLEIEKIQAKIAERKAPFAEDEEFQKYEAMLDDGIDLARLKYSEMRLLRKDLQIIFQDPYSSLNPRMRVGKIVQDPLNLMDLGSHEEREEREKEVFEQIGLHQAQRALCRTICSTGIRTSSRADRGSGFRLRARLRCTRSLWFATSACRRWTCRFSPRSSTCWKN